MADFNMLFAGFGGQGVLFAGKIVASAGLIENKSVSWLPSYGPEMRGGTANCSVCVSDRPIGSPLVVTPNVFVPMNLPSFDKFINAVVPGGKVILDSTLVSSKLERADVEAFYIPATKIAEEAGMKKLANVILVGKVFKETGFCSYEALEKALKKSVPASKAHLFDINRKAIEIGINFNA
jgi:2-oxoglutarate ferredoxin oxidoreductase subunit gamma